LITAKLRRREEGMGHWIKRDSPHKLELLLKLSDQDIDKAGRSPRETRWGR